MVCSYIINAVDFSPWIAPSGVKQSYTERRSKTVITMDGAKHAWSIRKRVLSVKLSVMEFSAFQTLRAALGRPGNIVTVSYPDTDLGVTTKQFYFQGPGETFRSRSNVNTWLDNISFTLEEV